MATFNRPDGPYPLHDTSDSNSTNLPGIYALQGYPPNSVADAGDVNAKLNSNGDWQRYHDRGTFKIEDIALSPTAFRLTLAHLTYAIGPIAAATTPTSEPVYYIRGQRIEFDATFVEQAGLSPIAWTPNSTTWIYCNQAATIIVSVQPLATPAAPPAGYFTVVGIDTNATDVVAIDTSSSPAFEVRLDGPTFYILSSLAVTMLQAMAAEIDTLELGPSSTTTLIINQPDPGVEAVDITGAGDASAILVDGGGHYAVNATGSSNTRPTISGVNSGTTPAVYGQNTNVGAGGDGVYGQASTVAGAGVHGVSANITDPGVLGESAAIASAVAVEGRAQHVDAFGVLGRTTAAATTAAAAVFGSAQGDGTAVRGTAADGYGVQAQSDQTSPARAALRLIPQNADPTLPDSGAMLYHSTRNRMRFYDGTVWRSTHASANGWVFGFNTNADGSSVTTTGNVCSVTITAEAVGFVELTATGSWAASADTTTMTVVFRDNTLGADVFTSNTFAAIDSDGGALATRRMPISYKKFYTLPASGSRTFLLRLDFSALVNWYDMTLIVRGVY